MPNIWNVWRLQWAKIESTDYKFTENKVEAYNNNNLYFDQLFLTNVRCKVKDTVDFRGCPSLKNCDHAIKSVITINHIWMERLWNTLSNKSCFVSTWSNGKPTETRQCETDNGSLSELIGYQINCTNRISANFNPKRLVLKTMWSFFDVPIGCFAIFLSSKVIKILLICVTSETIVGDQI